MNKAILPFCAAVLLSLALTGCPMQPSFKSSTITPIYAATNSGLYVYNGSTWTLYTAANGLGSNTVNSVVVSGSGAGASVYVGTSLGVSYTNDLSSWTDWTSTSSGLGSAPVNKLFLGSSLLAATSGGISTYELDSSSVQWTNDSSFSSVTTLYQYGTYSYIVGTKSSTTGLYIYNNTTQEAPPYTPGNILTGSTSIQSILVDSSLDVLAGTNVGLAVLYAGASSFTPVLGSSADPYSVNGLFMDSNGYIYAATGSGLYKIGSSSATELATGAFTCVYVDGSGTIYAGTSSGLGIYSSSGTPQSTPITGTTVKQVMTTAPLYSF
jgi:ligand-binding sensor domain-containing protein